MDRWQLWVDTGGTFTDCLAVDPRGRLHRAKILSTGALRGRVTEVLGPRRLRIELPWRLPADFLRGFTLRPLGEEGGVEITASQGAPPEVPEDLLPGGRPGISTTIELAGDQSWPRAGEVAGGPACELQSPEEAPLLAARLVTGTPLREALPPLAMRLATTRGTNALLERRGARTALVITQGFGDLLAIGNQQRPDLFALEVRKPAPLYETVVEADERLGADGVVLRPLDGEALGRATGDLAARGIEAVAVAFLHSYRNPGHEQEAETILRAAGITHVSRSAALAPLIQIVPRAETAVVDAYLSAAVRTYLETIDAALPAGSLQVMTSAGGLAAAGEYRPKDSLLSGPAGGVVGAAEAGRRSGWARVIAFDMGGTSTDVARCDGELEYDFETRVGAARLLSPSLAIETVAAGGGSVCTFDGHRLRVGPESAGARPGPACYGAGGPLTLTDVNLLLGRLDPGRFEIPLDPRAAESAAASVAGALTAVGQPAGREALLEGFLRIANERMADAIRRISVRRGYAPGDHVLVAFGGAGAQHACALAELLAIGRVLIPADASLLSALGLGHARVERFAERQVLRPLAAVEGRLASWLDEMGEEAAAAVVAAGHRREEVAIRRRMVGLRFTGQDSVITVEHEPDRPVGASFARRFRELYGYRPEERPVEVESLRVVASVRPPAMPAAPPEPPPRRAVSAGERRAHLGGDWRAVPVFERESLDPGAVFAGPALVVERHSSTVVPPRWGGRLDGAGALVLEPGPEPLRGPSL